MRLIEKSLQSIIELYGTEGTQSVLSKFVCEKNKEVQDFIRNKAIDHEQKRFAKTILIFDKDADNQIVGFYSISIKSFVLNEKINTDKKKKYFGTSQTNGIVIPSLLIGQLGRNDSVETGFTGKELMDLIFRYISNVDNLVNSVICYVEHNGNANLRRFYETYGFEYFKRSYEENNKKLYCHMIKTSIVVDYVKKQ